MTTTAARPSNEGSGTIATVGIIACILLLGLVFIAAASVQARSTRVQAVADMAALAGAECLQKATLMYQGNHPGKAEPCICAHEVVAVNGLSVQQCWQEGQDIRLVIVEPWMMLQWAVEIRGKARAGPL